MFTHKHVVTCALFCWRRFCDASKATWMRFLNHAFFKISLRYFNRFFNCVSTRFRKCETRSSLGSISSKRSVNSSSISDRFARGTSFRLQIWMCQWNCISIQWKGTHQTTTNIFRTKLKHVIIATIKKEIQKMEYKSLKELRQIPWLLSNKHILDVLVPYAFSIYQDHIPFATHICEVCFWCIINQEKEKTYRKVCTLSAPGF